MSLKLLCFSLILIDMGEFFDLSAIGCPLWHSCDDKCEDACSMTSSPGFVSGVTLSQLLVFVVGCLSVLIGHLSPIVLLPEVDHR